MSYDQVFEQVTYIEKSHFQFSIFSASQALLLTKVNPGWRTDNLQSTRLAKLNGLWNGRSAGLCTIFTIFTIFTPRFYVKSSNSSLWLGLLALWAALCEKVSSVSLILRRRTKGILSIISDSMTFVKACWQALLKRRIIKKISSSENEIF